MTRERPIPEASLQRIRSGYAQVEQLAAVIAEALGIPPETPRTLDLRRGVFLLEERNGEVHDDE